MQIDAVADVIVSTVKRAIAPTLERMTAIDRRLAAIEVTAATLADVRERMAVLETRAPVPGPAGANGADGKDGIDGVGFDDLSVDFDGDRTLALKFTRGDVTKSFPIVLPILRYQGVYQDGFPYVIGDIVTHGGHAWHCQTPTTFRPMDGNGAWRLMVKKGRDGKDAK